MTAGRSKRGAEVLPRPLRHRRVAAFGVRGLLTQLPRGSHILRRIHPPLSDVSERLGRLNVHFATGRRFPVFAFVSLLSFVHTSIFYVQLTYCKHWVYCKYSAALPRFPLYYIIVIVTTSDELYFFNVFVDRTVSSGEYASTNKLFCLIIPVPPRCAEPHFYSAENSGVAEIMMKTQHSLC